MRFLIVMTAATVSLRGCQRNVANAAAGSLDATATAPASRAVSTEPAVVPASTREVIVPAGTALPVVLDTAVGSATSRIDEPVRAHLTRPIVIRGLTAIPEGSRVNGVVTDATRSGRVKGRAHVAVRFESLTPAQADETYTIRTTSVGRTAPGTKRKDALEIGGPAAGGAIIGALVGGKKGALVGTAAGAGAGTAIVLSTRGKEVSLSRGAALTLRLAEPVTIRVRG